MLFKKLWDPSSNPANIYVFVLIYHLYFILKNSDAQLHKQTCLLLKSDLLSNVTIKVKIKHFHPSLSLFTGVYKVIKNM